MNKRKLNRVFARIEKAAKLDYAITDADEYGDCMTCVNYRLCVRFGEKSKGIWTKHWRKDMNKGCPWSELDKVYVAHDITPEQHDIMVRVFEENGYNVEPKEYDATTCYKISEREGNKQ